MLVLDGIEKALVLGLFANELNTIFTHFDFTSINFLIIRQTIEN